VRYLLKGLSLILLPLVTWLFVNATINRHTHLLSDGYYLTHAHPYDKTSSVPGQPDPHRHSDTELIILNLISDPVAPVILFFVLRLILRILLQILDDFRDYPEPAREYHQVYHYHAPPGH
jgi:hypothetical protein